MKTKIGLSAVIFALLGAIALHLVSASFSAAQKEQPAAKPKWEYKRVTGPVTDAELNKLGDDGWDLIKVEPKIPYTKSTSLGPAVGFPPITPTNYYVDFVPEVLYFKRAK